MGQVAITLKVMPESTDTDLNKLKQEIKKVVDAKDIQEKPIAFGLKCLEVLIILPDASGGTEKIEQLIASVHGVESVETEDITLL